MLEGLLVTLVALVGAAAPPAPSAGDEARHLIYLHGRIVQEEQSLRPVHPEYGPYEMSAIVEAFGQRGFAVSAELRPPGTSVDQAADAVVARVRELLDAGVPADRIAVVGASMGAAIALRASARLGDDAVRFALLGPCLATDVAAVADEEGTHPRGRLLVIREESDIPSSECPAWSTEDAPDGLQARELVIRTGLGHGFLYRPLEEWLEPVVAWSHGVGD